MSWKRWNHLFFVCFFILVTTTIIVSEYLLFRLNENLDINQSIEKQIIDKSLYGRLLLGQDAIYKLEMTNKLKPEILVIGSSRVMQFRNEFFNNSETFYNAGGCMPNINSGIEFINAITKNYTPKVVILGVDMWWLNGNFNDKDDIRRDLLGSDFLQRRLFLYGSLTDSLFSEKIQKTGVSLLKNNYHNSIDPFGNRPAIGLMASLNGDGFRPDGSYQYGGVISSKIITDKNFEETHKRVATGVSRFEYASSVDQLRLKKLINLIELIKSKGINVVVFAPPFAHEIYNAMDNSPHHKLFLHDFRSTLQRTCEQENVNYYDFSDITWYGSNDNETIDGFHGSETSYAKLTFAMRNDSIIGSRVATERINKYLVDYNPKFCVPVSN